MASNLAQAFISSRPSAQDARLLKRVFETLTPDSCPQSFNFHMHTVCSDGRLRPEVLMEQAIEIGLRGLAITDHHTVEGYKRAQHWLEDWQWKHPVSRVIPESASDQMINSTPRLWTGVEINANLLETSVHILGYAFNPEHESIRPYLRGYAVQGDSCQAQQVIHAIQSAGGLAVLAHPARYRKSLEDLILAAADCGVDGVEAYYAYDNPSPWRSSPERTGRIERLAETYHLLSTCGTDTHGLSLLRRL
ncbi:MAG: PHP domain-containing protein [Cyanothece sp. SIO1E1]|nr:PHP domain-containing protein [Cyanothece sp. SIO1E1]